jgi:hypothetical protein
MATLMPPAGAEIERVIEQRLKALEDGGVKETTTVEWRGTQKVLPVITMPVRQLFYNPDTHRIRAQRTLDPIRDSVVQSDPFSPAAQEYIRELLTGDPKDPTHADPDFILLRDDLRDHGQQEPGVITRFGVLINGNTRCAALRELGRDDIRVGVLPTDAALEDFTTLELALQLRRDFKREYSFVNFLLAIHEQVALGRPGAQIQREFRIRPDTLERSQWILEFINKAIKRSRVVDPSGAEHALRLIDFETHQGKLEELYRAYSALKSTDPDAADALLQSRLLALALNKSKTDLRLIDPKFFGDHLEQRLPQRLAKVAVAPQIPQAIPGLPHIPVRQPDALAARIAAIADEALKSQALANSGVVDVEAKTNAQGVLNSLDEGLERALDAADRSHRLKKKRLEPSQRLSDAGDDIEACVTAVREARSTGEFSDGELDEALVALRKSLTNLWGVLHVGDVTGDGISWLQTAVGR